MSKKLLPWRPDLTQPWQTSKMPWVSAMVPVGTAVGTPELHRQNVFSHWLGCVLVLEDELVLYADPLSYCFFLLIHFLLLSVLSN